LVLWFSSCRYGVELRVMCPVCGMLQQPANLKIKAPNTTGSNHLYNTLELLMMGIMVPETCWASNKICNKNCLLHLVGILFPHIHSTLRTAPDFCENVSFGSNLHLCNMQKMLCNSLVKLWALWRWNNKAGNM
jgi:hypothetical protein